MRKYYEQLAEAREMGKKDLYESLLEKIPYESRENVRFLFDGKILGIDAAIPKAQEYLFNEQDDLALRELEDLIETVEDIEPVYEDANFYYYSLQNKEEVYLFDLLDRSDKTLYFAKENYSLLYQTYGAVLMAQERIDEAREAFEQSLKWNPYDLETRLFLIETLKIDNLLEQFYFRNKELLKMAYSSQCLSIIYQNFAYYYLQKKEYKSAFYCFMISTDYGLSPDPYLLELLNSISDKLENEPIPSQQELYSYIISQGIPIPPDDDLFEFFLEKALEVEKNDLTEAMFCLSVIDGMKNSLEKDGDDELRIRKKYNRYLGNEIHKYQKLPFNLPKDDILTKLSLTKVYLPFIKNVENVDDFPCGLVENNEGEVFLPMYIFPSKIPQSQKSAYEMREVPFNFSDGLLWNFDDIDGIVLHPFSKDSFEIRKEELIG
ncbi:MAG: hypothetical protein Q4C49_02170 [Bacillota bacterium]|nr:hypothetical protein [Bacillota bacterium]